MEPSEVLSGRAIDIINQCLDHVATLFWFVPIIKYVLKYTGLHKTQKKSSLNLPLPRGKLLHNVIYLNINFFNEIGTILYIHSFFPSFSHSTNVGDISSTKTQQWVRWTQSLPLWSWHLFGRSRQTNVFSFSQPSYETEIVIIPT